MPVNILDTQVTENDIVNTTTETDLLSYSVPGDTLGEFGSLRVTIIADYLNNHTSTSTVTLKIKYGATTMYQDVTIAFPVSQAARYPVILSFILSSKGATNSQSLSGTLLYGSTGGATTGIGNLASDETNATTPFTGANASEDSTAAKTLAVTITHGTQNSNISFRRLYSSIEQSVYSVAAKELTVKYNIRSLAGKALILKYNIFQLAQATLTLKYNIRTIATKSLILLYNIRTSASKSLILSYNIRTLAGQSLILKYNIRTLAQAALILKYDIRQVAGKSLTLLYNIRTIASKSLILKYNILNVGGAKSLTLKYNIRTKAGATMILKYNIFQLAGKTLTLKYNIRTIASRTLDLLYNIRNIGGSKSLTLKYDIRQLAGKSLTLKYDIFQLASKSLTLSYNIRSFAGKALSLLYDIRQLARKSLTIVYNIPALNISDVDASVILTKWLEDNWVEDPYSTVDHYLIPPRSKITFGRRFDLTAGSHSDVHIHVRSVHENPQFINTDATSEDNEDLVNIYVEVRYLPENPEFTADAPSPPSRMMWHIRSYIDELIRSNPEQLDASGIDIISNVQQLPDANTTPDVHGQSAIEQMYTIIFTVKIYYNIRVPRVE